VNCEGVVGDWAHSAHTSLLICLSMCMCVFFNIELQSDMREQESVQKIITSWLASLLWALSHIAVLMKQISQHVTHRFTICFPVFLCVGGGGGWYLHWGRCIAVRKHMTLRVQRLKMCCAHKLDTAALCMKLNVMSRLTAIYLYRRKQL
jgi:hypothetical protein